MKTPLDTLLDELYAIDATLREHEPALKKLLEKMLVSRPLIQPDEVFARRLKAELLARPLATSAEAHQSFFTRFMSQKTMFALAGSALALVLVVTVVTKQGTTKNALHFGSMAVARLDNNAFGTLGSAGGDASAPMLGAPEAMSARVGGGTAPIASFAVESSGMVDSKMAIMAPYYNYSFVYVGEKLELTDEKLDVLKRIKSDSGDRSLAQALNSVSFGGINLGNFRNAGVTSFELSEDADEGYQASVNLREGTMSINQNWTRWIKPMVLPVDCAPGVACAQSNVQQQLALADIPADSEVIALSDSFLKKYGINLSSYGAPEVENEWRRTYEAQSSQPGFMPYIPEVLTVTYPLTLRGADVYDQGGSKNGLRVSVNIRDKKVLSVWQIQNQDYQASAYDAETDASRILKFAENGGYTGIYYLREGGKEKKVELGTPERIHVVMWHYDNGVSHELYVPALRFPIKNQPAELYQKNVIVPLVKEMLKDGQGNYPIMYMKGSAGSGVAEPAVMMTAPASPR